MDKVQIQKTKNSPEVNMNLDSGELEIIGESYPENAVAFYKPVFEWINKATESKKNIKLTFKLDYFNTSSSKCVIDILDNLDKYFNNGGKAEVTWFYKKDDDDMMETGEEFSSDIKVPFKIEAY